MTDTLAVNTPFHYVSEGDSASGRLILFLHGFPELAYSWRKVMPLLAAHGFWCVAVDVPGYGQSPPPNSAKYDRCGPMSNNEAVSYDDDVEPWCRAHTAHLLATFVAKLCETHGRKANVDCLVGHDMGSPQGGAFALLYPEIIERVILMSAPWTGVQPLADGESTDLPRLEAQANGFGRDFARDLEPRDGEQPVVKVLRALAHSGHKHYQHHYCEPNAASTLACKGESPITFEHALRCYYYLKSGHSWMAPRSLGSWDPSTLKSLPGYYLLPPGCATMQDYLAAMVKSPEHKDELTLEAMESAMSSWLTKDEIQIYIKTYAQTGFQSSLNYYRVMNSTLDKVRLTQALPKVSNGQLTVPLLFIAGTHDWGVYQQPGAFETMKGNGAHCVLIDGAGHWVQQEKPREVVDAILKFIH